MYRSQLVRSRLGAAGFAGGEASRCEPASCCEPAALSCWQIAEWLVGGHGPGRSAAASAHATRGALSGQHSRAAESRVDVLRPSHSSPQAAAVDSSSLTAKVTVVLHHTPEVRGTVAPAQNLYLVLMLMRFFSSYYASINETGTLVTHVVIFHR